MTLSTRLLPEPILQRILQPILLGLLGLFSIPMAAFPQGGGAPAASAAAESTLPWMVRMADKAPVVAVFVRGGALSMLHAGTGEILKEVEDPLPGAEVWRLDLDASGDLVALLTRDSRVWLWRWREEEAPTQTATLPAKVDTGYRWRFGATLEFDPTGMRLLAGHGKGGALLLDRAGETLAAFLPSNGEGKDGAAPKEGDGALEPGVPDRRLGQNNHWFQGLNHAWSGSGGQLVLATSRGASLFRTSDGAELASGLLSEDGVESLALNRDGTKLAAGNYGGNVTLHDVATGETVWTFTHEDPIFGFHDGEWNTLGIGALQFSPDESQLAATSVTGICGILLDVASGRTLWSGAHSGGRMGEPAAIAWLPGGEGFFFSFVSGVMPIEQVRIQQSEKQGGAVQLRRERGTVPDVGWDGTAVYVTAEAICAVDASTFKTRWRRQVRYRDR